MYLLFFVGISIIVIYYVVRNVWCSEIRRRTYRDCSLFFGIATPVLFEHQVGIEIHENALVKVVKYTMAFVFVFFCIFYGYVYIKDFRTISGNPRQFNYRDESVGLCISAH